MFKLKLSDYNLILDYARKNLPEESCGLLIGKEEGGIRTTSKVYLLENIDHSSDHFTISPSDQLQVLLEARKAGKSIIGVWHSHPFTPSRMSLEDIRLAKDETRTYLILSLMEDQPVLHAFRIYQGKVQNEELQIIKEAHQ